MMAAMGGRPPKPTSLLRLQDTYNVTRHGRRAAHERQAPVEISAKPPHWMAERQKRLYRQVVAEAACGVLRAIDGKLLTAFVLHLDVIIESGKAQKSTTLLDAEGKPSAYLRLLRQHTLPLVALAAQLGFSPIARVRLATEIPPLAEEPTGFELVQPKRVA
jgi:phage terminase small subunit